MHIAELLAVGITLGIAASILLDWWNNREYYQQIKQNIKELKSKGIIVK